MESDCEEQDQWPIIDLPVEKFSKAERDEALRIIREDFGIPVYSHFSSYMGNVTVLRISGAENIRKAMRLETPFWIGEGTDRRFGLSRSASIMKWLQDQPPKFIP